MSALVNGISTSTRERHDSMVPFYGTASRVCVHGSPCKRALVPIARSLAILYRILVLALSSYTSAPFCERAPFLPLI